jgi:hypothetical protein
LRPATSGWVAYVLAAVVLGVGVVFGAGAACGARPGGAEQRRTVTFRGDVVAHVTERVDGARLVRSTSFDGDVIDLVAELDADGFVRRATSVRRRGRAVLRAVGLSGRSVTTLADEHGQPAADGRPATGAVALPDRPAVLVELVHRLRLTAAASAVLVDLGAGEVLDVRIERRGPELVVLDAAGHVVVRALPEGDRVGPGAFAEGDAPPSLPSPPVEIPVPGLATLRGLRAPRAEALLGTPSPLRTAGHVAPGLFLESAAPAVRAFAHAVCGEAVDDDAARTRRVLEDARRVGEAVRPLVDAARTHEPPAATTMLQRGGDCDGAAALVVAALRACGHAARPLVGYRLVDAGGTRARLVPHAVAEVYTATGWVKVDATMPALGSLEDTFLPVVEGLGGALSLGRLLGVLDTGDVVLRDGGERGGR